MTIFLCGINTRIETWKKIVPSIDVIFRCRYFHDFFYKNGTNYNVLILNYISKKIQINPMPKMIIIGDAIEVAKHPEAAVDILYK